jgi:hypothetical protein
VSVDEYATHVSANSTKTAYIDRRDWNDLLPRAFKDWAWIFDQGNVDNAGEATSGEIVSIISRTVITVANEHAAVGFWGEFFSLGIINPQVGGGYKSLEVK